MQRGITKSVFAFVVMFWLLAALAEVATIYFDPDLAPADITWHVWFKRSALALFWIAITLLALVWYRDRPLDAGTLRRQLLATALAAAAVVLAYIAYFGAIIVIVYGGRITWPNAILKMWSIDLGYQYFKAWQIAIAVNAYYYYRRTIEQERERQRLQLKLAETELMLFRAQLEPHFLFNTLNSIASLVRLREHERAIDAVHALGVLLRRVLDIGREQLMPLSWELEFAQTYIHLQQLRFGEKLTVAVNVDDDVPLDMLWPVLLLQPLLENAIRHGPLMEGNACTIDTRIRRDGSGFVLSVRNALGSVESTPGNGLGLSNLSQRLTALSAQTRMTAHRVDGMFVVEIALPAMSSAPEDDAARA